MIVLAFLYSDSGCGSETLPFSEPVSVHLALKYAKYCIMTPKIDLGRQRVYKNSCLLPNLFAFVELLMPYLQYVSR